MHKDEVATKPKLENFIVTNIPNTNFSNQLQLRIIIFRLLSQMKETEKNIPNGSSNLQNHCDN